MLPLVIRFDRFLEPGVRQILTVHPEALPPAVRFAADSGAPVTVLDLPEQINFFGEALLERSEGKEGKKSVTLSFLSDLDLDDRPFCFIAELMDGSRFLIGAREPPYPAISREFSSGHAGSKARGYSYSVSWEGTPAEAIVFLPSDNGLQLI